MKAVLKSKNVKNVGRFQPLSCFFDIDLVKFNYFCLRLITKI